jgi:CRISPR-associated protein, csd1 family
MGWISTLYETYNNCIAEIAKGDGKTGILLPVSHSTAQAQIEITIDTDGNFISADVVAKEVSDTIIPVTEDSGTRSSGIAPHPLCDKLCYIAGDYDKYVKAKKTMAEYYSKYIESLKAWQDSQYTTEKVNAIFKYLSKGSIINDLVTSRFFETDEGGYLTNKKIEGVCQADCFVRFKIYSDNYDYISETWKDKELFDNYINYYNRKKNINSLCYATGMVKPITEKYPAKLRNTGDKSKIISSNDSVNFTYRGRFTNPQEASVISYDVSQKAHNALRWLIAKQGYKNGSNAIVCWSTGGEDVPDIFGTADGIIDDDERPNTSENFAKALNRAISGYRQALDIKKKVVIMSVDTADGSANGRLAIKMYQEFKGSHFLDNINKWYSSCNWKFMKTMNKNAGLTTPSPKDIAIAAYGTERNDKFDMDGKLQKNTIERILPCIIYAKDIPVDILNSAVKNVSRATSFNSYNHKWLLAVTCAIIKQILYKGDDSIMALDKNNTDRSYLFGRLLAVADVLEERTFEKDEKRTTNAVKYWNAFSLRPAKVWKIISERIIPYMDKTEYLSVYNKLFSEIHNKLSTDDFVTDKELSPLYILGYWCQRDDLYKNKTNNNKEINKEEK